VVVERHWAGQETAEAWGEGSEELVARPGGLPVLAVSDGNPGLHAARRAQGPPIALPRGPAHKLRPRLSTAPAPLREARAEE
jgi:hypothetical protein